MKLTQWLKERELNARRLASGKPEDIRAGWIDDADHFQSAVAAVEERDGLRAALKKANNQAEHFEREWYLRGDALEWYRDEAKALAKNMEGGTHISGVLASVTVLSLDAGRRADAVLSREHEASADCWCGPEVVYVDPDTGAKVFVHRRTQ